MIKNVGSGKCIAVTGNYATDGPQIVQWPCNPDSAGNQWYVEKSPTQAGYYLKSQNSHKCFVIVGASTVNGAKIVQYTCKDIPGFLWNFKEINVR